MYIVVVYTHRKSTPINSTVGTQSVHYIHILLFYNSNNGKKYFSLNQTQKLLSNLCRKFQPRDLQDFLLCVIFEQIFSNARTVVFLFKEL